MVCTLSKTPQIVGTRFYGETRGNPHIVLFVPLFWTLCFTPLEPCQEVNKPYHGLNGGPGIIGTHVPTPVGRAVGAGVESM